MAVLATALFTGAAAYVSLVEHPARLRCANEIGVVSPRTNPLRTCIEYMQVVTLAWLTMRVRIVRTAVRQLRHAAKRVRRGIGPGVGSESGIADAPLGGRIDAVARVLGLRGRVASVASAGQRKGQSRQASSKREKLA